MQRRSGRRRHQQPAHVEMQPVKAPIMHTYACAARTAVEPSPLATAAHALKTQSLSVAPPPRRQIAPPYYERQQGLVWLMIRRSSGLSNGDKGRSYRVRADASGLAHAVIEGTAADVCAALKENSASSKYLRRASQSLLNHDVAEQSS